MFTRLSREGKSPQRATGGFISRTDFVSEENARRAAERENTLAGRFNKILSERVFILDDIARGIAAAREQGELELDTERKIREEGKAALAEARDEQINTRKKLDERIRLEKQMLDKRQSDQEAALRDRLGLAEIERDRERAERELRRRNDADEIRTKFNLENQGLIRIAASKAKYLAAESKAAKEKLVELRKIRNQELADLKVASDKEINENKQKYAKQARDSLTALRAIHKAENSEIQSNFVFRRRRQDEANRLELERIRQSTTGRLENLPGEIEEANRRRFDFSDRDFNAIERGAAAVTTGLRELKRGFSGARDGLREFGREGRRLQSTMAQLGAAFADAASGIGRVVNIRWLFLISIIQVLLTLLINVGAALVAVASSAVMAGAALGGALAAGVAQALPVVGLLAAAMNRLEGAFKVVELRQRARDTAGEDVAARAKSQQNATDALADAQYNLAQAYRGVKEAEEGIAEAHERVAEAADDQREAILALADARKQAARAIVDASLDERDAQLSLREAELGVLDAKQRLLDFQRQQERSQVDVAAAEAEVREAQQRLLLAKQQGDQAEIASASQALSIAEQNASAIRDEAAEAADSIERLQLNVEQADLNVEQARIRRQRAAEENRRRQQQGVEGSPEVQAAKDRIVESDKRHADAIEGIQDAEQRHADALHNVEQAQRGVARAQQGVAESGEKQSAAAKNAQREFDKLSAGQKALVLASEDLIKVWNSKEVTDITDVILLSIARAIRRITLLLKDPEILGAFRALATEISKIVDQFSKWTISPEGRSTILFFIREAVLHLPIVAKAAGDFGQALIRIAKAASPVFTQLLERVAGWGESLEKGTQNTEKLENFFERAGEHLNGWLDLVEAVGNFLAALTGVAAEEGLSMVENLTNAFNRWAEWIRDNPEKVEGFFKRVHENLKILLPLLGRFIASLIRAFTSKEFQAFTNFVIETLLPTLLSLIYLLGLAARGFELLTSIPVVGPLIRITAQFLLLVGVLRWIFPFLKILDPLWRLLGTRILWLARVVVPALITAVRTFILIGSRFLLANPWVLAIVAVIAIIVLVIKHWDKVKAAAKIALEFILEIAQKVVRWFRNNWKDVLLGLILGPFALGSKIFDKIKDFGKAIIQALIDGIKSMGTELWDAIVDKLGPIGKAPGFLKGVLESIPNPVTDVRNILDRATGGTIPGDKEGAAVPAIVHVGEWVLNRGQQQRLAQLIKRPVNDLKMWLFGTAGKNPNGKDDAAPVGTRGATRPAGKPVLGPGFKLHPYTDDYGSEVWFVEMAGGRWGQVSARAAGRIAASGGAWMPGYVRRANASILGGRRLPNFDVSTLRHFASGGEVAYGMPGGGSYAAGGVVINRGVTSTVKRSNTVNQDIDIHTTSPVVDIDYVMRVAQIRAERSF